MARSLPGGLAAVLFLASLWSAPALALDTLRCGSALISVGDTQDKVRQACGAPDYEDRPGFADARLDPRAADIAVWYFNPGPDALIKRVTFHAGRVYRLDTADYGFNPTAPGRCQPEDLVEGLSKFRLLAQCGAPSEQHAEALWVPAAEVASHYRYLSLMNEGPFIAIYRERWIYEFGAGRLARRVTLENGVVTAVQIQDN